MATQLAATAERPVVVETHSSEESLAKPAVVKQGMGDSGSSMQSVDLDKGELRFEIELPARDPNYEPQKRFCGCLGNLDGFLPLCVVDFFDDLFLLVYSCIAPLCGWYDYQSELSTVQHFETTLVKGEERRYLITHSGNKYRVPDDFAGDEAWLGCTVQLRFDERTPVDGRQTCYNRDTGEVMVVAWAGGVAAPLQLENVPLRLMFETTFEKFQMPSGGAHYPLFVTPQGDHYSILSTDASDKDWVGAKVRISDDEQTEKDRGHRCVNLATGAEIRVRFSHHLGHQPDGQYTESLARPVEQPKQPATAAKPEAKPVQQTQQPVSAPVADVIALVREIVQPVSNGGPKRLRTHHGDLLIIGGSIKDEEWEFANITIRDKKSGPLVCINEQTKQEIFVRWDPAS